MRPAALLTETDPAEPGGSVAQPAAQPAAGASPPVPVEASPPPALPSSPLPPAESLRAPASPPKPPATEPTEPSRRSSARGYRWADLMRRAMEIDVLACPGCGGRLRLVATIDQPEVIKKILAHLGLPTKSPEALPARPPPMSLFDLEPA